MDPQFVLIPVLAVAGFVQAVSGFGSALVAMPILAQLLGIGTAAPLFAISAFTGEALMLATYRHDLTIRNVWRLVIGTLIAIPIGIFGSPYLSEHVGLLILGLLVFCFALYALLTPKMPRLYNPRWGYLFGFASGLFSGAYNTGGPPYIIYGATQGWAPKQFKANLQGTFLVGSLTLIVSHLLRGSFTGDVLRMELLAVPAFLGGTFLGTRLDGYVNPATFRRGVLILLLVLGLMLIF